MINAEIIKFRTLKSKRNSKNHLNLEKRLYWPVPYLQKDDQLAELQNVTRKLEWVFFLPPILLNDKAYLYHSNESLGVFPEHVLEGICWESQYSGRNGCSGWDGFGRSRMTLRESLGDTRLIHQLSNPILPHRFPNTFFDIVYNRQTSSGHKKPWTCVLWPAGAVMRAVGQVHPHWQFHRY